MPSFSFLDSVQVHLTLDQSSLLVLEEVDNVCNHHHFSWKDRLSKKLGAKVFPLQSEGSFKELQQDYHQFVSGGMHVWILRLHELETSISSDLQGLRVSPLIW